MAAGYKGGELLQKDGNFRWHVVAHSLGALQTTIVGSGHEGSQSCLVGCNDELQDAPLVVLVCHHWPASWRAGLAPTLADASSQREDARHDLSSSALVPIDADFVEVDRD